MSDMQRGFSLVELAVVLVIIGLLLGGMLMPLASQMERERREETQATLEAIREALIGYALINKRLPCPDTNGDGLDNDTCPSAASQMRVGALPYASLGVSATDAWGNAWRYAVNGAFTTPFTLATAGSGNGRIQATDAANCGGTLYGDNVPALVRSDGKTRNAGALEQENRDNDRCFVAGDYQPAFDDLVVWVPATTLFSRMVAGGQLP